MSTAMGSGLILWAARKVPFEFDKDYPHKQGVLDAMATIENNTRIWFCQRGNEANYVLITKADGSSHSYVGMKGGQQTCTINNDYIGLHEIGHTLGLIHEQNRTDRDNYIEVQWKDIEGGIENGQFAIDPQSNNLTGYDAASVMHYPAPAKGWGGLLDQEVWTMRRKADFDKPLGGQINGTEPIFKIWGWEPGMIIGWTILTPHDIEGLNKLYDNIPGWSYQNEVPNVGTTDSPALAVFQNRLYLAWKGTSDQHIWWSSFDGAQWSAQQEMSHASASYSPALAVFNNQLYMAWDGSGGDGIWWSRFDGANWAPQQPTPGFGTTDSPTLAVFGSKLYMAWKGTGANANSIWWSSFDGSQWSAQQRIEKVATSYGPALAVLNNQLYMVWDGSGGDGIWWSRFDGSNWAGQSHYARAGTTAKPALAVFRDKLYMTWKDSSDGHIWYADFNGSDNPWSGQARIAGFGTTHGPALAEFQNKLYMTWKGSGDEHIWYADFTL